MENWGGEGRTREVKRRNENPLICHPEILDAMSGGLKILRVLLAFRGQRPGMLGGTPPCTRQHPIAVNSPAPNASSGKIEKPRYSGENTGFQGGSPEGVEAIGFGKETSS